MHSVHSMDIAYIDIHRRHIAYIGILGLRSMIPRAVEYAEGD